MVRSGGVRNSERRFEYVFHTLQWSYRMETGVLALSALVYVYCICVCWYHRSQHCTRIKSNIAFKFCFASFGLEARVKTEIVGTGEWIKSIWWRSDLTQLCSTHNIRSHARTWYYGRIINYASTIIFLACISLARPFTQTHMKKCTNDYGIEANMFCWTKCVAELNVTSKS